MYCAFQNEVHMAYFCDVSKTFADSSNRWIPQVLPVEEHRPTGRIPDAKHISCFPGIHHGQILKQKGCKRRVSNAGFRCELHAKLLSPMNVKVIPSGPMRWRSLQDETGDFLFLSPDFALSLGPAEQRSCKFGTPFLVTQTDCSWTTFFRYPWIWQCLWSYLSELRNPK